MLKVFILKTNRFNIILLLNYENNNLVIYVSNRFHDKIGSKTYAQKLNYLIKTAL